MNLFDLNDSYRQLQNRDDLDPTLLADSLDAIDDDRTVKWDNLASWIDSNKSDIDFLTKRIKELQERKKYLVNQTNNIMTYLTDSIDDAGYKQVRTEHHILKPRNYKAGVEVGDPDKLPLQFIHTETKTISRPDKQAIYKALKAGEQVPSAKLVPNRKTAIN